MPSRKDVIEKALGEVYSSTGKTKGTMIESCAKYLDEKWETLIAEANRWADFGDRRDLAYQVHMQIWNWFPGGGTAEIAARKVIEAVDGNR